MLQKNLGAMLCGDSARLGHVGRQELCCQSSSVHGVFLSQVVAPGYMYRAAEIFLASILSMLIDTGYTRLYENLGFHSF